MLLLLFFIASQAWKVSIEPISGTTVSIDVVNTYDQPITFCTWGTPLDKNDDVFRADLFNIVDTTGNVPTYIGILEKKSAHSEFIYHSAT